jgi:uncharacterized protein (TIGR00297 family)
MFPAIILSILALISANMKPRIAFALFTIALVVYSTRAGRVSELKSEERVVWSGSMEYFNSFLISAIFAGFACISLPPDVAYLPAFLVIFHEFRKSALWNVALFTSGSLFYISFYAMVKDIPLNIPYLFFVSLAIGLSASLVESVETKADKRVILMIAAATTFTIFKLYIPSASLESLAIAFAVSFILSLFAMRTGVADESGLMSATLIGTTLILFTNIWFFAVILIFYGVGSAVTRYKYNLKLKMGIAEPSGGARGYTNVFGNSLAPLFFAMQYGATGNIIFAACFVSSVAAALGDTMASEIGKTSKKVYLITNFSRVEPGRSGGISIIGEVAALVGAVIPVIAASIVGIIPYEMIIFTVLAAFVAVHIDSLLGATLEEWGYLTNSAVNFLATLSAGIITYLLFA